MKDNYFYITKNYNFPRSAVSKAKIDCEDILNNTDFKNIGLPRRLYDNTLLNFFITLFSTIIGVIRLKRKSTICIQYPLKKYYNFIITIAKVKKCKIITVIHDLRSHRKGKISIKSEIELLNKNNFIISHNLKMTQWLKSNGLKTNIIELDIFDYLGEGTVAKTTYPSNSIFVIVFAGVLSPSKNNFIYRMDELNPHNYTFNLYGVGFNKNLVRGTILSHKGVFSADKVISKINGHFGLVWDGDAYEECSGTFGRYLTVNNPHKTSLYLRAGLPIITWNKAAIADFITQNNIGIVISSLEKLEGRLNNLSKEEYNIMQKNCIEIGKKLEDGYYFKNAIRKCIL